MAKACESEDVDLDQVLLVAPLLGEEVPVGADAGTVHQQIDLPLAFLQLQQETRQPQRFAKVTGAEQYFHTKALGEVDGDRL